MILPTTFAERTKKLLKEEYDEFEKALFTPAKTSIRINNKLDYIPSDSKVDWCKDGYYLQERPLFTADPFFHGGVYYVQEASSMFLEQVVNQYLGTMNTVLDLCAAPGGKSTHLSQLLNENTLLVSNEIIHSRAYILAENLIKWGNPNVVVTNNKPSDFSKLPSFFDAIVIDAPCSGEGMFRKDAQAINEWSEANVYYCANRQKEILIDVWDTLKTDGIVVYSTCTFNREENEENVEWICNELGAELLPIELNENTNIVCSDFGYRFYPHKINGEGFFISVLRKTSRSNLGKSIKKVVNNRNSAPKDFSNPLLIPDSWEINEENNFVYAFSSNRSVEIELLRQKLHCLHVGIVLAERKGKDFIPNASLALSKHVDRSQIKSVELDYEITINYLKKQIIFLPEKETGYILVSYKGIALGWVKNIGSRCNNLYPQNWRIRMNL